MTERRTVLKYLACATGTVAVGGAAVPAVALTLAPLRTGNVDTGGWTPAARLDDLAVGQVHKVNVVGTESDGWTLSTGRLGAVFLVRHPGDLVKAVSNVCPHLGCGVDIDGDHLSCPCHDSDFTIDGRRLNGPSPRDLDPIEVRVVDGLVSIRFQRFELGKPQRIPLA